MESGRLGFLIAAAVSGSAGVVEVVSKTETTVLNVPLSMLYVAIGGALIGVFLLPNKDAARVAASPESKLYQRILFMALSAVALGAAVAGYALMSAWTMQAAAALIGIPESSVLPMTGILGAFIRPLLPTYLKAVDGVASRVLGRVQ